MERCYHERVKIPLQLVAVSGAALVLNFIWEHLHSALYMSYRGAEITNFILFRAALFDAAVTTLFSYPFLKFKQLKQRRWLLYLSLVIFAVFLEKWALLTGRWIYADAMPIIPILDVGLTPAVQLGILGYLAFLISYYFCGKKTASRESVSTTQ